MDIFVNVINQKLRIATNLKNIVSGTQNFVRFRFNLSDDWKALKSFAQFRQGDNAYNQYLDDDDSVYLPPEIVEGTCTLMLYGNYNDIIGTSNYITLVIDENMLVTGTDSTDISETLYNQLTSEVRSYENRISKLESTGVTSDYVKAAVEAEMEKYLSSGVLANMAIVDGSITRDKVDQEFENTLQNADSSMQPHIYDPQGRETDIFAYIDDAIKSNSNSGSSNSTNLAGAVVYDSEQDLLDAQKSQARSNIGAVSENEVIDLISTHAGSGSDTTTESSAIRQVTDAQFATDGTDISVTMTLDNDEVVVSDMIFGEDGLPQKIVTGDNTMTLGWSGFEFSDSSDEAESTPGENGATFTPSVSEDGTLSWTNDKGLDNPTPVNIMGPAYTLTDDDKATIVSAVLAELPSWEGGSY